MNCWEFKKCGKGTDCPVYTEKRLDGIHGGDNAGRACWMVAGSMCGGEIQGTYAQKIDNCVKCDFYQSVMDSAGLNFQLSGKLKRILKGELING